MPREAINSIDDYDRFLSNKIEAWTQEQRLALAAAMAERWLHVYEEFSTKEDWGDPASLRQSLEAVWNHLRGKRLANAEREKHLKLLKDSTPHMDDFDAYEALAACMILSDALECCTSQDNTTYAVRASLSCFEAAVPEWPLDEEDHGRLWRQVAARSELKKQLALVDVVETMHVFDDPAIQSLRKTLKDSKTQGKATAKVKKAPVGQTNQELFEQYRRMVESDIKSQQRNPLNLDVGEIGFVMILFSVWLGRYSRRLDTNTGNFGKFEDAKAQQALHARSLARDAVEQESPDWDNDTRQMIDLCMKNICAARRVDVDNVLLPHGYGPSLRFLWAQAKRKGLTGIAAWRAIVAWSQHRPAAWEAEDKRKKKGLAHSSPDLGQHLGREVNWATTQDVDAPWQAEVEGRRWQVRLNDFPDDYMYSLLIGGELVGNFHDWPETWQR